MNANVIYAWVNAINQWLAENGNLRKTAAVALMFCAAFGCAKFLPWGEPRGSRIWQTGAAATADHQVLAVLLTQNRDEVRFWQGVLFNVSALFIAGILGIVSLALKTTLLTEWLRWTYSAAVVFLCTFYLTFVDVADSAIWFNHRDLTGIEIALNLTTKGAYINGEIFYDHSVPNQIKQNGERFVKRLVYGSLSLGLLSVVALLFSPIRRGENGPRGVEQTTE